MTFVSHANNFFRIDTYHGECSSWDVKDLRTVGFEEEPFSPKLDIRDDNPTTVLIVAIVRINKAHPNGSFSIMQICLSDSLRTLLSIQYTTRHDIIHCSRYFFKKPKDERTYTHSTAATTTTGKRRVY